MSSCSPSRIGFVDPEFDDFGEPVDMRAETLGRLSLGEQFAYTFDFGDDWTHLLTVGDDTIDPEEEFGDTPEKPTPNFGWGSLPDQYGRRWRDDDGETRLPPDPGGSDLPPILPQWS